MKDIHARVPVNKTAALVTSKGEHYVPNCKDLTYDSDFPIKTGKIKKECMSDPRFIDLSGNRFGRFTVIGMSEVDGLWVVRCDCGKYSTRRRKAILNPNNSQDRCGHCRHKLFIKREEHYRKTGRYVDVSYFS